MLALAASAVATVADARPATIVTSSAPDRVALTVYRAPYGRGAIDLGQLDGFALVSETRRLRLPRGVATIRFEGVAAGIVPVSAIVDGLPGGTIERNRDARLLSPASLIDGTLGRQVTLTRTDRATGRARSEPATIVAGPSPGVILRTADGIEALRCSGLSERLGFAGAPAGLSARPVLSVTTDSPIARSVTVRLSYLAGDFDWRASYVATLAPAGDRLDLFAWLTLANGNPEAFPAAQVQAVAGRLNRVATPALDRAIAALRLTCFPLGTTTSDLRQQQFEPAAEIVVTASRRMMFSMSAPLLAPPPPSPPPPPPPPPPEDLGDLKLYRVPERTTVAPHAQKQVALLSRTGVSFERRYRRAIDPGETLADAPTAIVLLIANEAAGGLGVPLPAGGTALYARQGDARLLLGLGTITDRAIGEKLRLAAGTSTQVRIEQHLVRRDGTLREVVLTATNANSLPVRLDLPIGGAGRKIEAVDATLERIDGIATWTPRLPPGGQAQLRYRY